MARCVHHYGGVASLDDIIAGQSYAEGRLPEGELASLQARPRQQNEDRKSCRVGCGRCIYRESAQAFDDLRHPTPGQTFKDNLKVSFFGHFLSSTQMLL